MSNGVQETINSTSSTAEPTINVDDIKSKSHEGFSPSLPTPAKSNMPNIISELKRQLKRLSHNNLANSYIALYAQNVRLSLQIDGLNSELAQLKSGGAEGASPIIGGTESGNLDQLHKNIAAIANSELSNV